MIVGADCVGFIINTFFLTFKISSNDLPPLPGQGVVLWIWGLFWGVFRATGGYQGNSHLFPDVWWWWCCRMLRPSWSVPPRMEVPPMLSELSLVCLFGDWCWIHHITIKGKTGNIKDKIKRGPSSDKHWNCFKGNVGKAERWGGANMWPVLTKWLLT